MTQEEKDLLTRDLCARIPYGVLCKTPNGTGVIAPLKGIVSGICYFDDNPRYGMSYPVEHVLPYLRPMSSMTHEEILKYDSLCKWEHDDFCAFRIKTTESEDWLLANHFDRRELIPKGLALEATEDRYKGWTVK
jgi:hypothetical protein